MSEERECTNFASAEDVLVWLSGFGGGPNQPSVEKVRDAIKFARAAIADEREVRQWAERQRDVAERGLADAHDVLATLRTERDEARAQLDALREAAERFLVDDANGVTETAGLVAALADTAGAARERAERQAERERAIAVAVRDACSRRVTLGCGTCNAVGSVTYEDMQEDDSEECEACEGTGHAQHADIHAIDLDEIVASVRGRA